jgi:hypothetical protein
MALFHRMNRWRGYILVDDHELRLIKDGMEEVFGISPEKITSKLVCHNSSSTESMILATSIPSFHRSLQFAGTHAGTFFVFNVPDWTLLT